MSGVYLAAPAPVVDVVDDTAVTGLLHRWVGANDVALNIGGDRTSGVRLAPGPRGMWEPDVEAFTRASPAVPGAQFDGDRVVSRDCFWRLNLHAGRGQAWIDYRRAVHAALRIGRVGRWEVTQPGTGETRVLQARVRAVEPLNEWAGEVIGYGLLGVTLVADEQPYWQGPAVRREFRDSTPVNYYGGGPVGTPGFGPPYVIGSSGSLSSATIENAGEVDAHPVATIVGPSTSVDVGVDGQVTELHFPIVEGRAVILDGNPTAQTALDATVTFDADGNVATVTPTGVDRTAELGEVAFAAVPPGAAVPLDLVMVGTGSVMVELTPLHECCA